jgi:hypothetical protein
MCKLQISQVRPGYVDLPHPALELTRQTLKHIPFTSDILYYIWDSGTVGQ